MSNEIINIDSISILHDLSGLPKPKHPLITVLDVAELEILEEHIGLRSKSNLYTIGIKDKSCAALYGRASYDFNEGVMFFLAPNQVQTVIRAQKKGEITGWMILFHPDLIRNTQLGKNIDNYSFFSYAVNEALHLSESEQKSIEDCLALIQKEIAERTDNHSQIVISSTLELLLNLANRFYERQFNTRAAIHTDLVDQFESLLRTYYAQGKFKENGAPTLEFFSENMRLSPSYLSDLLKKQTGLGAKDYINNFTIEKAKTLLLSSQDPVGEIAYNLGFNYPHYFSRFFKSKTGKTPVEYRQLN